MTSAAAFGKTGSKAYKVQIDFSDTDDDDDGNVEDDGLMFRCEGVTGGDAGNDALPTQPLSAPGGFMGVGGRASEMHDDKYAANVCNDEASSSKEARRGIGAGGGGPAHSAPAASSAAPATASEPVKFHFDAVVECLDSLRRMQNEERVTKQDVIDSLSSMLGNMLSSILMHNFATSMSVKGWRVE
jgi:hypothetical protein